MATNKVTVKSRSEHGRWRAGLHFTRAGRQLSEDDGLTKEQLRAIAEDPELVVLPFVEPDEERMAREAIEQAAAEKAEADRIAANKQAAEKAEADRIAADKQAAEKAEADRIAADKAVAEKAAATAADTGTANAAGRASGKSTRAAADKPTAENKGE